MTPAADAVAAGPARIAVVLVTADWAGPAKPAATVIRELSRRWGPAVHSIILESPEDDLLGLLDVDVVPTWLRLEPVRPEDLTARAETRRCIDDLVGEDPLGEERRLPGRWMITHRRRGALPKHVVAEEFGPGV